MDRIQRPLGICGGTDYRHEDQFRGEAILVRIITGGGFLQPHVTQAAVVLPPTLSEKTAHWLGDHLYSDEPPTLTSYQGRPNCWVLFIGHIPNDQAFETLENMLNSHSAVTRVKRQSHTLHSFQREFGYDHGPQLNSVK